MSEAYGQVQLDGDQASLYFERFLKHSPERIWRALTDPGELRQWYMAEALIDGRPGGSVDLVTGPARFHWTGKILTWEPHSVFEYEMNTPPHPHLPNGEQTVVRYELVPSEGGTLLRVSHSRLSRSTALGFAPGSHAFLDRLKAHLDDAALPNWMQRYEEVKSGYPQWEGPQA